MLIPVAVLIVCIILVDSYFCDRALQREREATEREIARLEAVYAGERDRLVVRVKDLEWQVASHVAHVLKLPPPIPPRASAGTPLPLPEVMQKFLDAIEDEEARAEYETDFRQRLTYPNADPAGIVAEALQRA